MNGEVAESGWQRLWRRARERWGAANDSAALREAVQELIEETGPGSDILPGERQLLTNILALREKHVSDCMVPRADIVAVEAGASMADLVDVMARHAHSRIPVYRETLDDTIGMAHMKDVMACVAQGRESTLRELLRPVLFVAPSMPAAKLLLQMRQSRQHMAMVVDEFGGVDGIVTIEDLVEEIVGEIEDEHDEPAAPLLIARPDGTLLVDARLELSDFEARVGTILSGEERATLDTVGGYVVHLAGRLPSIGETVTGPDGLSFDVLETDPSRVRRVRVRGARKIAPGGQGKG